jgi:hypothetical protein
MENLPGTACLGIGQSGRLALRHLFDVKVTRRQRTILISRKHCTPAINIRPANVSRVHVETDCLDTTDHVDICNVPVMVEISIGQ